MEKKIKCSQCDEIFPESEISYPDSKSPYRFPICQKCLAEILFGERILKSQKRHNS